MYVEDNVELKNVNMMRGSFRNFSGEVRTYNKSGERKFSILLPPEIADELEAMGWYVKRKPPYREGEDPQNQFDISLRYDRIPPVVTLISSDGEKSMLTEETVGLLDTVDVKKADLVIRPYNWDVNGKTGVKAMLHELKVWAKPPRRTLNAGMQHDEEDDPF